MGLLAGEDIRRPLDEILADMDSSGSALKDAALSLSGSMAAIMHSVAGDEIVKNSFANYAFEHFEIAAYKSLLTLADDGGFEQATAALRKSLAEEEAMAAWIAARRGASSWIVCGV